MAITLVITQRDRQIVFLDTSDEAANSTRTASCSGSNRSAPKLGIKFSDTANSFMA